MSEEERAGEVAQGRIEIDLRQEPAFNLRPSAEALAEIEALEIAMAHAPHRCRDLLVAAALSDPRP